MRNLTARDNQGKEWVRVQKRTAKNLFNVGAIICFCPSNLYPFGPWHPGIIIDSAERNQIDSFESVCDSMGYYNLSSEAGRYIHFYTQTV